MIEISHLLLIASTECVQYGFCRRILPSALGRSCYYCHRDSSDSCRRDFNLVSLICRLWNALSTSRGSVHVYRFSTIFAIDRVWFGSMSMYSSWKRQLLLCESCFAEALELPLDSFLCPDQAVPTLHNPTVNMCPFAESSFRYQALQLFLSHIIRRQMFANLTVNKLSYSAIAKQKITCVIDNNVLKVLRLDISLRLALVSPYA